ncbi:MAG: hypothetical protein GY847_00490 [Proteobacteria bacterium]|nr:hypothetical protein [Pseudomonadota bacterium]
METTNITIVVSAYTIENERIEDYVRWNRDVFESEDVFVVIVCDRPLSLGSPNFTSLVYPKKLKYMAVSKLLNYGIRSVNEGIIVRSDIDIVFSREVVRLIKKQVNNRHGLLCFSSNAPSYDHIQKVFWHRVRKRRSGHGACLALHRTTWHKLHGYNENLFGWGFEDTDVFHRAKRIVRVTTNSTYPLYHIKHVVRVNKDFFLQRNNKNRSLARRGWRDSDWGIIV